MIKKILMMMGCCLTIATLSISQNMTQTVRGMVIDADSQLPLIGVSIWIADSDPYVSTSTNAEGKFRLVDIPIGRINLQMSYIGYENKTVPNVVLNSAKEVVLKIEMQESLMEIDEAVVVIDKERGEALNDMALISVRSISPEETNRYAGGFNDPSRIMSNFAGVTNTQDGSNDIIIRGNSPKYIQWRLEGIQITNPNHFADQSSVGGSISTLNNNLLSASDFYTGAFSPEFGNALSGVYDVRLRTGNNEKMEAVFGFGLIGTDFTLEGPFKKGYGGSFLVNYRYSTASIIADLGLIDDLGGVPKFQDAAFKVVLPTKKFGLFSFFGLSGISSFLFEDVKPSFWETPGDNGMKGSITEDFDKGAHLLNTGMNHTMTLSNRSFIKTTLSYSNEGINDGVFESQAIKIYDSQNVFLRDSIVDRRLNFKNDLKKSAYRGAVTYNNKISSRHKIQIGTKYAYLTHKSNQSQLTDGTGERFTLADFNEHISSLRNFVSWKYRVNKKLTLVSGVHHMNVILTKENTIEPRIAVNWKLNNKNSIHAGYGNHSTMESIHHYFTKVNNEGGTISESNKELGLLKANHFVVGYEKRIGKNLMAKVEGYYQDLYDIPVENDSTSFYATINEGLDSRYVDLVNEGTGENYGVEFTLERFFDKNYYYLINASLYESKYIALDGIERNTQYNSNYLVNFLVGKEFEDLGKKNNQTLGLNAKVFFGGGKKIIPLLRDSEGNLDVDPDNNQFWDYAKAYENKLEDVYQVIVSASYKWNKPKGTHELFLNLDNVTNTKGRISEFYDEEEPDSIGYLTQFGFFPNLMYRVYF